MADDSGDGDGEDGEGEEETRAGLAFVLGPSGFDFAQHKKTLRPSVDGIHQPGGEDPSQVPQAEHGSQDQLEGVEVCAVVLGGASRPLPG
jgi:hypothetical protein